MHLDLAAALRSVRRRFNGSRHQLASTPSGVSTRGEVRVLEQDAGWCWFHSPRAIIADDHLLIGSVASGHLDESRRGSIEVLAHDLHTAETTVVCLASGHEVDDHNAPALWRRSDGRVLAAYARHGLDGLVRMRTSEGSDPAASWEAERHQVPRHLTEHGVTYANLLHIDTTGDHILNVYRGAGFKPCALSSDDGGDTWNDLGQVLGGEGRPYIRLATDTAGRIHVLAVDQHPRDFDNSLYHGIIENGVVLDSWGNEVGHVGSSPPRPDQLTRVFEGSPDAVAWCNDLVVGPDGSPTAVYSVQVDGRDEPVGSGGLDHRLRYCRLVDGVWHDHEVAHMGSRLYPGEDDYTGLATVDPLEPSVVYFSSDVDPHTGQSLPEPTRDRRQVFKAIATDEGSRWAVEQLTADPHNDNIRPICARTDTIGVLAWLRGRMATYSDYRFEAVVLVDG